MGKSTTAGFFRDAGAAHWDADAAVHRLYAKGGAGVVAIERLAPAAIVDGEVRRDLLKAAIARDPALLKRIEAAIHPLVQQDRAAFVAGAEADIVVCDIPLLFETNAQSAFDAVVVVTAPPEVQRARVLARPGMSEADLATILARQMPDAEKRARADFVIDTSRGIEDARQQAQAVLAQIRADHA